MSTTRIVVVLFVAVCFASALRASSAETSRLVGMVVDANGSRIAGATITVERDQFERVVKSNDDGKFEVEAPAGTYELTVEQGGFKKFHLPGFRFAPGTCELVNIHMDVQMPRLPRKINR
ncbi:MAG TPA: carboxypeptidase-like regulatory domain-containing protein [Pyrinomonadaceae bacterium]|nr:carboxypeptidase-like regulatory domain-containing protein [Pyrinomonadaceae bacterium]